MSGPSDPAWRSRRPRGPYTTREGVFVDDEPEIDHPCSRVPLGMVSDPPDWQRRVRKQRCPGKGSPALDYIPADIGVVDVRPNVGQKTRREGCRTEFKAWSIWSHIENCRIAVVQDVWLLGARFHISDGAFATSRRDRQKGIHSWVYGLAMPAGSIAPDPSSAIAIGFDPWSVVHPGFFEVAPGEYRSRLGRDVRDDRYEMAAQYAAAHLWIDTKTETPRIVVYRRLLGVDGSSLPSGALSSRSAVVPALAGMAIGAGLMHAFRRVR